MGVLVEGRGHNSDRHSCSDGRQKKGRVGGLIGGCVGGGTGAQLRQAQL